MITRQIYRLRLLIEVAFFRKYDAFLSLPPKCAENYPEK
jgi:hypothetical protein